MILHVYQVIACLILLFSFFFNDTATTETYTLSLHDALPISHDPLTRALGANSLQRVQVRGKIVRDRKSTRLNSCHTVSSYAVFCLKKKKIPREEHQIVVSAREEEVLDPIIFLR